MSKNQKKRDMPEHQEWTPHWGLNLAYRIWMVIFSGAKILIGAISTVLLIGVVCAFVFTGVLDGPISFARYYIHSLFMFVTSLPFNLFI